MMIPLLLVTSLISPRPACSPQFAPLQTGSFVEGTTLPVWRKSEAGTWGGKGWLGWNDGGALVPVELIVRDRPKNRSDDDDEVTVEAVPKVDYAVRCIPGLHPRKIRKAAVRSGRVGDADLQIHGPLRLTLLHRHYEVRLQAGRKDLFDAKVIVTDGTQSQTLYSVAGFADEPHFTVEWAGDLDGDGKLDLITDMEAKYSWHPFRLLLSSLATTKQLVGAAALFETGD